MKGLAPSSLILAGASVGLLVILYLIALVLKKPRMARVFLVAMLGIAAICATFLALDKFVGVGYTSALYIGVGTTVAVGLAVGLVLRKER